MLPLRARREASTGCAVSEAVSQSRRGGAVKAREGVVELLNQILTVDLTAINQYFIHSEMCKNWGYERLYEKLRDSSIAEMKDAQAIIRHILYLEGVPNLQRLGTVRVGENAQEHLELDLEAERSALELFTRAIAHCAQVQDYTTRNILEEMIRDEEEHIDWLETQLEVIRQIGLQAYLTQQLYDE
jgi:bacterioferritin